jgi:hypothetical protein
MNTTHTTQKTDGTELISTVRSLHIYLFLLHMSHFQLVVQGGIVYGQNLNFGPRMHAKKNKIPSHISK